MLLGFDEYPLHQITASFAGVGGSDASWSDGHYVCLADDAGNVCLTSNLRLYSNNDVMDGFVCIRHDGRQHNIRVSRRLRPAMDELRVGPLRLEILEPMKSLRIVLEDNAFGIALDVTCRGSTVPYEDPSEVTRVDGRLISERMTYELTGKCEGWVQVGDGPLRPRPDELVLLPQPLVGLPGRAGWAEALRRARAGPQAPGARGAPVGALRHARARRLLLHRPERPAGVRQGRADAARPHGRRHRGRHRPAVPRRRPPAEVRLVPAHRRRGRRAHVRRCRTWGGCTARAAATSAASTTDWARACTAATYHAEGEVWDVSHPTEVVDASGRRFEFEHAWAENFTRLTSDGESGLAHFECVVIQEAKDWTS